MSIIGFYVDGGDWRNAEDFSRCRNVTSVQVTPGFERSVEVTSSEMTEYAARLSNEGRTAKVFNDFLNQRLNRGRESYVEEGGLLRPDQMLQIVDWVKAHPGQQKVVILDNLTLTSITGFYYSFSPTFEGLKTAQPGRISAADQEEYRRLASEMTLEGLVNYLVGGTERVTKIRLFFQFLNAHHVVPIVISRDPMCEQFPTIYREVMGGILQVSFHIVCMRGDQSRRETVRAIPGLAGLCE
jgi:hypothetical protein